MPSIVRQRSNIRRADDELARVGFMSPSDAGSFVAIHDDEDSSRRRARQIETYF